MLKDNFVDFFTELFKITWPKPLVTRFKSEY